jgi:hypothetical protein
MKKTKRLLLGLTLGMLLVGCSQDEEVKDCNCDRVKQIISPDASFGGPGQPVNFSTPGRFITINDCTGVQLEKSGYNAEIGQCR